MSSAVIINFLFFDFFLYIFWNEIKRGLEDEYGRNIFLLFKYFTYETKEYIFLKLFS